MRLDLSKVTVLDRAMLDNAGYPYYDGSIGPVDTVYRVEQSAGYDDVVVAHYESVVILFQRGKVPVRMETDHAHALGRLLEEWHGRREDTRHLARIPECSYDGYGWTYLGRDNGNFGDWTLIVAGRNYLDGIHGSHRLDEMADALLKR